MSKHSDDKPEEKDAGLGGTTRPASGTGLGPGGAAPPGGTGGSGASTRPGEPFGTHDPNTKAPAEERERAGLRKPPAAPTPQHGDTRPGHQKRRAPEDEAPDT